MSKTIEPTTPMIRRAAEEKVRELARCFPAVSVIGPRQSGKTTLVRTVFPDLPYVLLEDPDTRSFAEEDPRGFLSHYEETGAGNPVSTIGGIS